MASSLERKRFVGALCLFMLWVVLLGLLAIVSAYRPAARTSVPDQPAAASEHGTTRKEQ